MRSIPTLVALVAAVPCPLTALPATVPSQDPARAAIIAVVNANVVRLDSQAVLPLQTVLVSEGRILSVGLTGLTAVPKGSRVIDAARGYLLPGLVDAHVHLSPGWRASGFAEARRYLARGITTVVNFSGSPELLDLRQEIELGRVLGPTLYTAGPYIDEPVVRTPSDVEREVARQLAAGYDFLKFHPVDQSGLRTTSGLSREAYIALLLAGRKWKVPVMGHLPRSASLETALEAGQGLAHVSEYIPGWFLPLRTRFFRSAVLSLLLGVALFLLALGIAIADARAKGSLASQAKRRIVALSVELLILAAAWAAFGSGAWSLRLLEERSVQGLAGGGLGLAALGAVALLVGALWSLRRGLGKARVLRAGSVALGALSAGAAIGAGLLVVWRNTPAGHSAMLRFTRDTRPWVSTTLVVAESKVGAIPQSDQAARRLRFLLRFTRELQSGGARLLLGTDTGSSPALEPGVAFEREFTLLLRSGLTPYQALRAATVLPARFLGKENDFGRIAAGLRADLLLVEGNPLEQPEVLAHPRGVMVRGRWLTPDQ